MTITNCQPSQKYKFKAEQTLKSLQNQRWDQGPRRSKHPLLTGQSLCAPCHIWACHDRRNFKQNVKIGKMS